MCTLAASLFYSMVVCHNLLSCGVYTALVSLVFGTAIPTSFSILMKMFYTCFTGLVITFYCSSFSSIPHAQQFAHTTLACILMQ